tara:strand:- start:1816 stop:2577 length:762 start_codon:yes stop_codon:yes gene_type:complete
MGDEKMKKKTKIINLNAKGKKNVSMLTYNRPVNRTLVNKLKASMEKYGVLSAVTVYEGDDEYLLVDGQHRWTAASELGLDMPAISISWDAMTAMVEMNTIQVNWTLENFVDFFSAHVNPEISQAYSALKGKRERYPHLTYSSLHKIFGSGRSSVKKGKWRLGDEERGETLVTMLEDLLEYLPYAHSARFIDAFTLVAYNENYDHSRMMKKLKQKHGVSLSSRSKPADYGRMLTKIYNYNTTSKHLVMFKANWI